MKQNVLKKRGGFTLIEVILAIVVVAVIMGIVIPKVMSNSDKAQIKQVISSDVRSIIQAAADWKRTSADAKGTYAKISADKLNSRLPSNMEINASKIQSSGFNGGCVYGLAKSKINQDGDSFVFAMDCTNAKNALNWSAKLQAYATEAFKDTVKSLGGSNVADDTSSNNVNGIDCSTSSSTISCITKISQ